MRCLGPCRFDLIYLVLDKAEEATDRKLARHLLSLHYERHHSAAQVRCTPSAISPVMQFTQLAPLLGTEQGRLIPRADELHARSPTVA